jgi:hypothetical protein
MPKMNPIIIKRTAIIGKSFKSLSLQLKSSGEGSLFAAPPNTFQT